MSPINSKNKGDEFEREIAQSISKWWYGVDNTKIVRRTPGSGSFSDNHSADMYSEIPGFPFSIECKHSKDWEWADLWKPAGGTLMDFWKQCVGEVVKGTIPMLVFKGNRTKVFAMFRDSDFYIPLNYSKYGEIIKLQDCFGQNATIVKFYETLLSTKAWDWINRQHIPSYNDINEYVTRLHEASEFTKTQVRGK